VVVSQYAGLLVDQLMLIFDPCLDGKCPAL
jgi:hypothetical protein